MADPMTDSYLTKADNLRKQVDSFHDFHWKSHVYNRRMASALIILGLLLGAGTTAAAFLEQSKVAGVLGLLTTLFIALSDAFNFSEKADFYLLIHSSAKSIRDRLKYMINSDADFSSAFDDFQSLRLRAANEVPKGKGIGVAKQLTSPSHDA
jgi:hypothetical protein